MRLRICGFDASHLPRSELPRRAWRRTFLSLVHHRWRTMFCLRVVEKGRPLDRLQHADGLWFSIICVLRLSPSIDCSSLVSV
jgi:hypothetical protein